MKKLIAVVMMLGMFANAAFAVKGVAPNAKTLAELKDMGKKHSSYLAENGDWIGFELNDDGSKVMSLNCFGICSLKIDKDGYFESFIIGTLAENDTVYNLWFDKVSGKMNSFAIKNKDFKYVLVNEYYAVYNPDGSIDYIVDPKGNIV
jgi:hypothetical protein